VHLPAAITAPPATATDTAHLFKAEGNSTVDERDQVREQRPFLRHGTICLLLLTPTAAMELDPCHLMQQFKQRVQQLQLASHGLQRPLHNPFRFTKAKQEVF
jgi:hypothetical protein